MKLTEEQCNQVIAKLQHIWSKEKTCDLCGEESWHLQQQFYGLYQLGDPVQKYPLLVIACKNCGNSKLINASIFGFTFSKNEEIAPAEEAAEEETLPL